MATIEDLNVAADALGGVERLYEAGQYLSAHEAGRTLGPLSQWPGTRGRLLAARLATNLGSPRLGQALVRLAWRNDRADLLASYYHALVMFRFWGPLRTWRTLRRLGDFAAADDRLRADWQGLWAQVLASLRDFDRAHRHMERALQLSPEDPWIWVQRSAVLALSDRPEEALESTRKAVELRPFYRPAVQSMAAALLDVGRDEEALELLAAAAARLECGDVIAHLAAVQTELGMYAEARENYERLALYYPLIDHEKHLRDWLAARRSDAAYFCGDYATAATLAREVKHNENYRAFAERLEKSPEGKRLILNVGFVRQDRETCAPATLAAISNFWQVPADHEQIARQICYDGTPPHHERQWADDQGFVTREFRLTWDSVTALLNRGVPLTLTTVSPGSAHLQAIIGYDDRRCTLVIRDPSLRTYAEYDADELFKQFSATGPRGMAMVPAAKQSLLEGIELPDAELYDGLHRVNRRLAAHDRTAAQQAFDAMRAGADDHPLVHRTGWSLTVYDSDMSGGLVHVEALLKAYPDDVNLLLSKLSIWREFGRREERMELLQTLCSKTNAHPLLLGELAVELSDDARTFDAATYLLRRVVRYRPVEGRWYGVWANLLWAREQREEALELYRFAACLDDKLEGPSSSYFVASRNLHGDDESMAFLRERFARLATLSSQPARTLAWALDQLNQFDDLFGTLEEALRSRPDDGELCLLAADYNARYGRHQRADTLLEQAQGKCHPTQWLRQAARMANYRGQPRAALDCWQQALANQPLDGEAQAEVARLLKDLEGRNAALANLRAAVERFPHHYRLRQLLIEWIGQEPPAVQEVEVRALLALHQNDAWAQRELAMVLFSQGRWEEAEASAETARRIESTGPVVHWIFGRIRQGQGRLVEARLAMREAIRQSVDYQPAIDGLMNLCDAKSEREEALRYVRGELERQVIFGDGLLAFREHAAHTWGPQATLELLQQALTARPDLWHAHSAVVRQLAALDRWEEAQAAAREAVRRFPLLPRIWLDLATAHRGAGDAAGEIEALAKALEINPAWGEASCELADAEQRHGNGERARQLLERALVHEPQNARVHATLADLLWGLSEREAAVGVMKRAAELVPENDWVWKRLREWLGHLDRPQEALELVRQATAVRPHSVPLRIILAEMCGRAQLFLEAVESLDRAIVIDPRHVDAHSLRAYFLSQVGRWDEAIAACQPSALGETMPLALRSREAHLIWQRGNRDEALKQMRVIVEEDPEYYWAWTRLAEWYNELDDVEHYLEASQHLTRIAPKHGISHGYEGHARWRGGDHLGAKASLKRALALMPDYRFAIDLLFDLQIDDGELDEAERSLQAAQPHLEPAAQLAGRIDLAVGANCRDEALKLLRELCLTPQDSAHMLEKAIAAFKRGNLLPQVASRLQSQMSMPTCDPHVGRVWVSVYAFELGHWWRCSRHLKWMKQRGPGWHLACQRYVERAAQVYSWQESTDRERVRKFVATHAPGLRENVDTWSAMGQALLRVGDARRTAKWMADWRQRPDVQPRHLLPLAEALWGLERPDAALAVSQYATQRPSDPWTAGHRLLLTLGSVWDGKYRDAERQLKEMDWEIMSDMYQSLYNLLYEGVIRLQYAKIGGKEALARLRRLIRSLGPLGSHQLLLKRAVLISQWRVALDHNCWWRAKWYRARRWLL